MRTPWFAPGIVLAVVGGLVFWLVVVGEVAERVQNRSRYRVKAIRLRNHPVRSILATLAVAAVLIPFVGYSARGTWPLVDDPRGMAGVGIIGALLTLAAFDPHRFGRGTYRAVMWALALAAIGFGLAALLAETVWWLLVPMVTALVGTWAAGVFHNTHAMSPRAVRHG